MLYDTDGTQYRTHDTSSKRLVALSGLGFQYPFVKAPSMFNTGLPAKMFSYRISETKLYDQYHEYMYRLPLEIIYFLYALWFLFDEMSNINAAREQFYKHKFTSRRRDFMPFVNKGQAPDGCYRICCEGSGICCSSGWDFFDIANYVMSISCIICSWVLSLFVPLYNTTHADIVRNCMESGNCYATGRAVHFFLITALSITGLMNILGVFKYTRYHEGMRVYTMLFYESWKTLRDFIPWFLLLIYTQAWFISQVFSASGEFFFSVVHVSPIVFPLLD